MTDIWPVIHLADSKRTVENARIAARCGCPGVFLISNETKLQYLAGKTAPALTQMRVGKND